MTISLLNLPRLALSIRQPWAHACAAGWKDIENRKWRTAIRGPICIHASAFNKRNFEELKEQRLLDTPVPVKGALGFFEWRPRVINQAPAQQAAPAQKGLF